MHNKNQQVRGWKEKVHTNNQQGGRNADVRPSKEEQIGGQKRK